MNIQSINMLDIVNIAFEAGEKILEVYYANDIGIEFKDDASPLTIADKQSHLHISQQLAHNYPEIPILSEEGVIPTYSERKTWHVNWVIDPLDGTKEFIKRNGEFTVNIGLIEEKTPVLGVIYSPAQDIMYFASSRIGSYKLADCQLELKHIHNEQELLQAATKLPIDHERDSINVAVSRSHFSDETQTYIDNLRKQTEQVHIIEAGSSIKMCLVAEGVADIYPRLSYSMEWDTAAGEAIVKYSGGTVVEYLSHIPIQYNRENLKNPFHIVKKANLSI